MFIQPAELCQWRRYSWKIYIIIDEYTIYVRCCQMLQVYQTEYASRCFGLMMPEKKCEIFQMDSIWEGARAWKRERRSERIPSCVSMSWLGLLLYRMYTVYSYWQCSLYSPTEMTAFSNTNIPIQLCRQLFQITTTICKVILDVALAVASASYSIRYRCQSCTYNIQQTDCGCLYSQFIHSFRCTCCPSPTEWNEITFSIHASWVYLCVCVWLCVLFALLPVVLLSDDHHQNVTCYKL